MRTVTKTAITPNILKPCYVRLNGTPKHSFDNIIPVDYATYARDFLFGQILGLAVR